MMNATELADELENTYPFVGVMEIAATMLRQQQAEIGALKKDNKELHAIAQRMAMAESDARKSLQWFKDAKEMNNNFLDYCFGITLIFFGVIMFIIGIGLDIGVIK